MQGQIKFLLIPVTAEKKNDGAKVVVCKLEI